MALAKAGRKAIQASKDAPAALKSNTLDLGGLGTLYKPIIRKIIYTNSSNDNWPIY